MSFEITINSVATTTLVLCVIIALAGLFILLKIPGKKTAEVKSRLHNYAVMLNHGLADSKSSPVVNELITADEHKILLGIIKKVEAKNATLLRVWTFFGAATLTLFRAEHTNAEKLALVMAMAFILIFLFASLRGIKQIDHLDSRDLTAIQMQDDLIKDMLGKERSLRFSMFGAYLITPIASILLGLYVLTIVP